MVGGKWTSIWGTNVTTDITMNWNNKSFGRPIDRLADLGLSGPEITIHQRAIPSAGILEGTGRLLEVGNRDANVEQPSSMIVIRADLNIYKEDWGGDHDFATGVFIRASEP